MLAWFLCFRDLGPGWPGISMQLALASYNYNRAASHNQHWLCQFLLFKNANVAFVCFANVTKWVFSTEVCIMQQFLIVYLEQKQGELSDQERGKGNSFTLIIVKANHSNRFIHLASIYWVLLWVQPHLAHSWSGLADPTGWLEGLCLEVTFGSPPPSCLGENL